MAICVSKAMKNAMPAYWALKIMMHAVTKIVNYVRKQCVAIRIHRVVKVVNICVLERNVGRPNTLHVNKNHGVLAVKRSVQKVHRWPMELIVKNVVNVNWANVYRIVRRKGCKAACVTSVISVTTMESCN